MAIDQVESRSEPTNPRKSLARALFPFAKRCVQALPAGLLRFRPYGIFEIRLESNREAERSTPSATNRTVSWIESRDKLLALGDLVSERNVELWDGIGCRVAIVWHGDQPVGAAWLATDSFVEEELGVRFQLCPGEAWLFAAGVIADQRRNGCYTDLLSFVKDELANSGCRRILLGVTVGNDASLAAHGKAGARQIGCVFAARILGLTFCRIGGTVKRTSRLPIAWRRPIELAIE